MLRLKKERLRRGWSQAELGRRLRMHPSTLSHLEQGHLKPWPRYRRALERQFGMSAEELFREVEELTSSHD